MQTTEDRRGSGMRPKYTHCIECGEPFSGSNVHTVDGALETQISGMCEDCFDEVCAECDDEEDEA